MALALFGCGRQIAGDDSGASAAGLGVPARVEVDGTTIDVEADYLPRVVQCEDPNASLEAMKAQAVAARTYLTYLAGEDALPSIHDGQSDQVYTCPANDDGKYVSDAAAQAVAATSGQIVQWNGVVTAGFFVAGASRDATHGCRADGDATDTERFVTYNYGLVGDGVVASSIGDKHNAADRGCLSQRMADCLASDEGYDYASLLRYFYGSDIQVAALGAAPLDPAMASTQAQADAAQATCYSNSLERPVPLDGCALSTSGRWYQCQSDGSWSAATVAAGSGSGPDGKCAALFGGE